jgi:hypothetical protein
VTVGDLSVPGSLNVLFAAVVFTWLFQRSGGSVLLMVLFHASHQNSVRYLGAVYTGADRAQLDWIGVAIWGVVAVAVALAYGRVDLFRRSKGRDEASHPDASPLTGRPVGAA